MMRTTAHFLFLLVPLGLALKPLPTAVATVRRAGVDVHIVGAIHSTPTSARDVDETVRATQPSAVVLELCGGRWRGLLSARAREIVTPPSMRAELREWWNSSVRTKAAIGAAPALISASLSLPYAVMRATGSDSFRPGSEFLAVLEAGEREGGGLTRRPRIILGDVDAADTLTGLARALQLRAYAGRGAAASLAHARRQFGVLRRALGLDDTSALRLGTALGRVDAMRDALVLMLPATLALVAVELIFGGGTSGGGGPLALDETTERAIVALNACLSLWIVAGAPDAIEAMLDTRDDALASAIEHACYEASERGAGDEREGAEDGARRAAVVAVVGMLHVNGVAARLSAAPSPPNPAAARADAAPRPHRDWTRGRGLRAGRLLVAGAHVAASSPYYRAVLLLAEPADPRAAAATRGWTALRLDNDVAEPDANGARAGGPCARPTSLDGDAAAASTTAEPSPRRFRLHRTARLAGDGDTTLAEWGGSPLFIASDKTAARELGLDEECGIELVGCSAWWPGQLEVEVAAGDWHVVDAPADASSALFGMAPINETSLAWARLVPPGV